MNFNNIGRNDPCPCGSGKKYKKCCYLKTISQIEKQELIRSRLIDELMAIAMKYHKDSYAEAYDHFWNEEYPEDNLPLGLQEFAEINFNEWFLFDWPIDEGEEKTLVELHMTRRKNLSSDELEVLKIMNGAVISLYEVQEVIPDKGLVLKDILLNGDYAVSEKKATESLRKWDILATRLLYLDGKYIMSGCVYPFPVQQKREIVESAKNAFRAFKKEFPGANMKDMLKTTSMFNDLWYRNASEPVKPILITTDREPFVFSRALFEIKDRKQVIQGLKKVRLFKQTRNNEFTWEKRRDKESLTLLGTIRIKGKYLTLECNSRERLKRGKRIILKAIPDLVFHKSDTFQDPYEAMEKVKDRPRIETKIPVEFEQEFYDKFMRQHMEKWLNEKIPALDNKTPFESIKTKKGRARVVDLLKSFENTEEQKRRDGRPYYDLSWVWKRLHLTPDD
jgi:hypothetical protein